MAGAFSDKAGKSIGIYALQLLLGVWCSRRLNL